MPEIEDECVFEVAPGNILLQTQVNGDRVTITGCHFTKENAAALAWMLNNTEIQVLEIQIKEKS